jgi:prefoldin subunit 5
MNSDETSIPEESNWPAENPSEEEKRQPLPELKTLGTSSESSPSPSQAVNLDASESEISAPETVSEESLSPSLPDLSSSSSNKQPDQKHSEGSAKIEAVESPKQSSSLESIPEKSTLPDAENPDAENPDAENEENVREKEFLQTSISELERRKTALETELTALETQREHLIASETTAVQEAIARMILSGTKELEERRDILQGELAKLEKRRDRVREELSQSFSGVSQDIAIRVQSFKNYLVGSLQDLATTAEQLDLPESRPPRESARREERSRRGERTVPVEAPSPRFAKQGFKEQQKQVSSILDRYRTRPDYYGPPWQLRRTFEPIHAERVQQWFFKQGGRGTVRSMGSRLQNILIASAAISVLRNLYDDRLRVLVLANTPERLGEWRRGLQDCLGISRGDFGPQRGISLFESPEALVQKADRFVEEKQLPIIIMDETEDLVNLSLLQFPLWLAFAPDPTQVSSYVY